MNDTLYSYTIDKGKEVGADLKAPRYHRSQSGGSAGQQAAADQGRIGSGSLRGVPRPGAPAGSEL